MALFSYVSCCRSLISLVSLVIDLDLIVVLPIAMAAAVDVKTLPPGDPRLVQAIIDQVKANGTFDELRKELISDVDTKPAYQVEPLRVL